MRTAGEPNDERTRVNGQWDAIIVNFNGSLFLDPCLRALDRQLRGPSRIIVVDNASDDDSLNELAAWPEAEVIQSGQNLGYAGGANRGMHAGESSIAVILNPDVELDAGFGQTLLSTFAEDESLGAAGAKLRFPDSKLIQHAGGRINWPELTTNHFGEGQTDDGQFDTIRDVDYVTGAALAIRRNAFDVVGGFDERYFPAYWEDVDFCFRLRDAGWKVQYRPDLTASHFEGSGTTRGNAYFTAWTRNRLRFAENHLSTAYWTQEFIPAEVDRLRGELSAVGAPEWFVQSGGASIEELARYGAPVASGAPFDQVSRSQPLLDAIASVESLSGRADPAPPPLQPSDGVMRRVKRFMARFSGRIYAEEFYWQQRQFNESIVRAFEAQDRLNRELVAELLFSMLLLAQRKSIDMSSTYQVNDARVSHRSTYPD